MRSPCGFDAASMSCSRGRPSGPGFCLKPAVRTTAAFVPCSPSSEISPGTVCGGVHRTANSGPCGKAATFGYARTPRTASYFGFTGKIGPWNPPASRFSMTVAPTLCGRTEAPITATDLGRNKEFRWRILISNARAPKRMTDCCAEMHTAARGRRTAISVTLASGSSIADTAIDFRLCISDAGPGVLSRCVPGPSGLKPDSINPATSATKGDGC